MKMRFINTVVAVLYGASMYYAGIISQKQKNQISKSQKIEIEQPLVKNISKTQQSYSNFDTFTEKAITPHIRLINYPNFKILYSTYFKCPLAVHQKITKQLAEGNFPRRDSFFPDQNIQKQFRVTDDIYKKSQAYKHFNFSRGHMAAAGNYSGNKQAKFQTFTFANIVPQNQFNNGGIWNTFQRYAKNLVTSGKCQNVQIISGPIYSKNIPYTKEDGTKLDNIYKTESIVLFENGVVAPQKLFKIIKCNQNKKSYIDGFQFWNKKTFDNDKSLKQFKTSIQSIQNQTGLKFNIYPKFKINQQVDLLTFDSENLSKTKRYYDEIFYNDLMKKSTNLEQLNNSFNRAKQQQIYITLQNFYDQTKNLFNNQIQKNDKQLKGSCQKLSNLMKINKNLFYLKQLTSDEQKIIEQRQKGLIAQCLNDESKGLVEGQRKSVIKSIRSNISYSFKKQIQINSKYRGLTERPKIFSYINEHILKDFLEAKQYEQLKLSQKEQIKDLQKQ